MSTTRRCERPPTASPEPTTAGVASADFIDSAKWGGLCARHTSLAALQHCARIDLECGCGAARALANAAAYARRGALVARVDARGARDTMRAARATRTPRRASRRPVVRAPRARAALLTGNTSLVADEARRARRLGARRERRRSRAGRKRRRECRRGRGPGSVRSMHSPRNPRAMPSADKDDRARWSGVCRRDCALSVAESTSHAAAKPCRERATAWSALRQPK